MFASSRHAHVVKAMIITTPAVYSVHCTGHFKNNALILNDRNSLLKNGTEKIKIFHESFLQLIFDVTTIRNINNIDMVIELLHIGTLKFKTS